MKSRRPNRCGYGWIPDVPDHRDFKYSVVRPSTIVLPPVVDLRSICPPIVDQGELGSCTANSLAGALGALMKKDRGHSVEFSRLFIYFNERRMEGTIDEDAGAMIRDGIKSLASEGACFEINWPYDITKFTIEPEFGTYAQGQNFKVTSYHRLDNTKLEDLLTCLAEGYPFVFGFTVFDSFESKHVSQTGIMPMPLRSEENLGGHAVAGVGYNLNTRHFIIRNSWGPGWGSQGYFMMPFDYISDAGLADDFWTIRAATNI